MIESPSLVLRMLQDAVAEDHIPSLFFDD